MGNASTVNPASARRLILEWAERGQIHPDNVAAALDRAGVLPDDRAWRRFIDRLLLGAGTVLLAAGVVFFIAWNWQGLDRFFKFAAVEALLVLVIAGLARTGLDRPAGRGLLAGGCLLVGALLALIGQVYQTGADTHELFIGWALLILPWVWLGRFALLWILWLALLNVGLVLYFTTFGGLFGQRVEPVTLAWTLFLFDTAALAVWKALAVSGVTWLRSAWAERLLLTVVAALATLLGGLFLVPNLDVGPLALPAWAAWLVLVYRVYRHRWPDLYALAAAVCSVIAIATESLLGRLLYEADAHEATAFLLLAVEVVASSAIGGRWLMQVAREPAA